MNYFTIIADMIKELEESSYEMIDTISEQTVERLKTGGIIHLFGSGHSSLLAQDVYYRAGGLVPVHPITPAPFMLHNGAEEASRNERKHGLIVPCLEKENMQTNDVLIVISTSGRNPAPIEAALYGKEKGLLVVGMLSKNYTSLQRSKHKSGKRLEEVVDLTLDTQVPVGDAVMSSERFQEKFTPVSSVAGTALLHSLITKVIEKLAEENIKPPIFKSGNVDGKDEHNQTLISKYRKRISF